MHVGGRETVSFELFLTSEAPTSFRREPVYRLSAVQSCVT